jgi:hypothetical protein
MSRAPYSVRYYEDPSISQCTAVEYDRLWQAIADKVAAGEWFYRAREIVLAEELPDIHKAFGVEVANRVSKAIQHTSPERIPRWARQKARARRAERLTQSLIKRRGRVGWLDRLSLKLTGMPFW